MHIKLTRDYSIRGERRHKGEVVDVIDASATWLIGHGIAIKAADGSETDNGDSETDNRQARIEAAIRDLIEADPERTDDVYWTKSGKPEVKVLESLLGFGISAAERDAAMAEVTGE